jgi:hypothetical protein
MNNIDNFNSKDDMLISKFMKENRHEIENIDFSHKVVSKIKRQDFAVIAYIISFIGGAACCVVFFMFDGSKIIYNTLLKAYNAYVALEPELIQIPVENLIILSLIIIAVVTISALKILTSAEDR